MISCIGVIASNAWSNNGDVVIGIISTLSAAQPFNEATDYPKGVSYASIFMVFTFLTLWVDILITRLDIEFTWYLKVDAD